MEKGRTNKQTNERTSRWAGPYESKTATGCPAAFGRCPPLVSFAGATENNRSSES